MEYYKKIDEIETEDELVAIIDEVESHLNALESYLSELETAKEEQDEFNKKMEADIDSNRYFERI